METRKIFVVLMAFLLVLGVSACGSGSSSKNRIPNGSYPVQPDSDSSRNYQMNVTGDTIYYSYEIWTRDRERVATGMYGHLFSRYNGTAVPDRHAIVTDNTSEPPWESGWTYEGYNPQTREEYSDYYLIRTYETKYAYSFNEDGSKIMLTRDDGVQFIGNIEIWDNGFTLSGTGTELDRTWTK